MRLIDGDFAAGLLLAHEQNARAMEASGRKVSFTYADGIRTGYADVGMCPTIEAVIPVTCRECKWSEISSMGHLLVCTHESGLVNPKLDSFCSWGERREDGQTD